MTLNLLALQKQLVDVLKASPISLSLEEVATKINAPADVEFLYAIARHLHANSKLLLEGDLAKPASLKLMLVA